MSLSASIEAILPLRVAATDLKLVGGGQSIARASLAMTGDDWDPSSEFPPEIESVPPPATNEIDVVVDVVSAGGRPRVGIQAGPADEMAFELEAAPQYPPVGLESATVFQPAVWRWGVASVAAFAFGGLLSWGVLRTYEPRPTTVAQNGIPPVTVPPLSRPARPPAEVLPRPAAVSRPSTKVETLQASAPPAPAVARSGKPSDVVPAPASIRPSNVRASTPAASSPAASTSPVSQPVPLEASSPSPPVVNPVSRPPDVTPPSPPLAVAELAISPALPPPRPEVAAVEKVAERPRASLDEDAVRETLHDYEHAYRTLDVVAAVDVWPTVDRRALARAFGTLKSQGLAFESCEVRVAASSATARCRGTVEYVRKVGSPAPQFGRQEWVFKMRKLGSAWKIDEVMASQVSADGARSRRES